MFGKLIKLKQAAEFASKAEKAFPMNRRKFLQGLGSLGLSAALPGKIRVLPKAMAAAGKAETISRAPWINAFAKGLHETKGTTILGNGGTIKLLKTIPDPFHTKKQFSIKTVDGESDLVNYTKSKNGDINIEFDVRDDFNNNQHIYIDGKTKKTELIDENYYMTSPDDYAKDDPIIYDVLTSQKDIGKRYGLAKGDTIDGEMIDRLAIPEDGIYSTLFERHADTFSPSGNLFGTKKSAQQFVENQRTVKKNTEIQQMDDWESQFRGGSMHGYNIGGIVNKLRTVGSLTKNLNPTKPIGKIASGQMQLPKHNIKASTEIIDINTPKGPYTITEDTGARVLDRDFDTVDDARNAITELSGLRTSDPSTFRIFGARPPKTKDGVSLSAPEVSISKADDARMPAMFWKSREEIANAKQSTMSGQQWLSYLKNKYAEVRGK